MKRDMDLIRRIVLAVQDSDRPVNGIDGIDHQTFASHAELMAEAGLIKAVFAGSDQRGFHDAIIFRLTWNGHEFAQSVADETLWQKAKENVIKPSGSWTFGILTEYLKAEIAAGFPVLKNLF